MTQSRPLTHDEKKASEAAFRGLPFDPVWSRSAQKVYDGIVQAMGRSSLALADSSLETSGLLNEPFPVEPTPFAHTTTETSDISSESQGCSVPVHVRSRREAIESGILVDVTPAAHTLGLDLSVGMTKLLWEHSITPAPDLSEEEVHARVRDVLLAVRLHFAGLQAFTAFAEIPVLLSFPSDPAPQHFSIYALFHKDPVDSDCLLLIHPGELASINQAHQQN